MTVDVLGTPYSIEFFDYGEKPYFKQNMADGYCDNVTKEIVMCNMQTYPGYEDETPEYCRMIEKKPCGMKSFTPFSMKAAFAQAHLNLAAHGLRTKKWLTGLLYSFQR